MTPRLVAAFAVVVLAGCSSSSSSSEEKLAFRDTKGRQCTTQRFPPTATCDSPPAPTNGCAAGSTPCFLVSTGQLRGEDGGVSGPYFVRNCDGCCKDGANSSSTTTADCVPLVCTSNADCAGESTAACVDGQCRAAR